MKSDVNWNCSEHCVVRPTCGYHHEDPSPCTTDISLYACVCLIEWEMPPGRDFVSVSFVSTNICWIQDLIGPGISIKVCRTSHWPSRMYHFIKGKLRSFVPSGYSWCLIGRWAGASVGVILSKRGIGECPFSRLWEGLIHHLCCFNLHDVFCGHRHIVTLKGL